MIALQDFGRTGHASTRTIFGAAALGGVSQEDADRTLEVLLQYGVNHIDTAASYGDSELRIGPWMREHRQHFFLATKTGQRQYAAAKEELHRSLDRLKVDSVDLLQLHNLADPIEWDIALSRGGALDAAVEAREQGLVKFIGVTGHGSQIAATHRRSLERFDFDSVLLPFSFITAQDAHYTGQFDALAETCADRHVALQTIKAVARRPWSGHDHTSTTWYEPFEDQEDLDRTVHWVLGRPGIFLNTVGDIRLLPRVLDAASRFVARPSDELLAEQMRRAEAIPLFV